MNQRASGTNNKKLKTAINSKGSRSPAGSKKFIKTNRQQIAEQKKRVLSRLFISIATALFLALVWLLLFSGNFNLKSIEVTSSNTSLADAVSEYMKDYLSKDNYLISNKNRFLWTETRLSSLLKSNFPSVENTDLRIVDGTMKVSLEVFKPVLLWCEKIKLSNKKVTGIKENCFAVNKSGQMYDLERIDDESALQDMLVITDQFPRPELGDQVIDRGMISQLKQLRENLEERGYFVSYIVVKNDRLLINTYSNEDKVIIDQIILPVDKKVPAVNSLADLYLLLDQNELFAIAQREDIEKYEYVDFMSPNKVFYKFVKQAE